MAIFSTETDHATCYGRLTIMKYFLFFKAQNENKSRKLTDINRNIHLLNNTTYLPSDDEEGCQLRNTELILNLVFQVDFQIPVSKTVSENKN